MGDDDPKKLSSPQERDLPPLADNSTSSEDKENVQPAMGEASVAETPQELCATPERAQQKFSPGSPTLSARDVFEGRVADNNVVRGFALDANAATGASLTPLRQRASEPSSMLIGHVDSSFTATPGDVTASIMNFSQLLLDDERDDVQVGGACRHHSGLASSAAADPPVLPDAAAGAPGQLALGSVAEAATNSPRSGRSMDLDDLPELPEDDFRQMRARDAFRDSIVRPSHGRVLDSPERVPVNDLISAFERAAAGAPLDSDGAPLDTSGSSPVHAHSTWVSIGGSAASEGSPTVDMEGVIGAIASKGLSDALKPDGNGQARAIKASMLEPQVPEGRRSFAAHLSSIASDHATGEFFLMSGGDASMALPSVQASGTPGFGMARAPSDFAPLFPPLASSSKAPEGSGGASACYLRPVPASGIPGGGPSLFSRPGGDSNVANAVPGLQPSLEIADPRRLSAASTDSALPTKSSLQPILPLRGGNVDMLDYGVCSAGRSSDEWAWDEFLKRCDVNLEWPSQEQVDQLIPRIDEEPHAAGHAPVAGEDGKRAQRATEALVQQRAACVREVIGELGAARNAATQQYDFVRKRWNDAFMPPPLASELQRATSSSSPAELEAFKGRMQGLQNSCKERAMLKWHEMKNEWLSRDLAIVQQHTKALQQELAMLRDGERRLDQISARIKTAVRQQRHRADVQRTARQIRDLGGEDLMATQDDKHFLQRRLPEMQASLEGERISVVELERQVAEEREAVERDREAAREAQRRYLRQKAKRVALERERYAHTCNITSHTTATSVTFSLRGGAQASFEPVAAEGGGQDSLVRLRLRLTRTAEDTYVAGLSDLQLQLFARAWCQALATCGAACDDDFSALLSADSAPHALQQLDLAAVRIVDIVRTLKGLPSLCPEVARISASLQDGASTAVGSSTNKGVSKLVFAVTLLVARSHSLGGDGVLRPRTASCDPLRVDGSQCMLVFSTDVPSFPEVSVADISVRRVFGPVDAEALLRAIQGGSPRAQISEALIGAAELLKRMAPQGDAMPTRCRA